MHSINILFQISVSKRLIYFLSKYSNITKALHFKTMVAFCIRKKSSNFYTHNLYLSADMATDANTPFIATVDSVFEYTARIAVDTTVASRYFGDYSTFQRVAILLRAGICGLKKKNIRRLRIMIRVYLLTNFFQNIFECS